MRNFILSAALAACLSIGAARAENLLVTTLQPGGEIAIVVSKIEAVQPRDGATCFVWLAGRRYVIAKPYAQMLNVLASETAARRVVRQSAAPAAPVERRLARQAATKSNGAALRSTSGARSCFTLRLI